MQSPPSIKSKCFRDKANISISRVHQVENHQLCHLYPSVPSFAGTVSIADQTMYGATGQNSMGSPRDQQTRQEHVPYVTVAVSDIWNCYQSPWGHVPYVTVAVRVIFGTATRAHEVTYHTLQLQWEWYLGLLPEPMRSRTIRYSCSESDIWNCYQSPWGHVPYVTVAVRVIFGPATRAHEVTYHTLQLQWVIFGTATRAHEVTYHTLQLQWEWYLGLLPEPMRSRTIRYSCSDSDIWDCYQSPWGHVPYVSCSVSDIWDCYQSPWGHVPYVTVAVSDIWNCYQSPWGHVPYVTVAVRVIFGPATRAHEVTYHTSQLQWEWYLGLLPEPMRSRTIRHSCSESDIWDCYQSPWGHVPYVTVAVRVIFGPATRAHEVTYHTSQLQWEWYLGLLPEPMRSRTIRYSCSESVIWACYQSPWGHVPYVTVAVRVIFGTATRAHEVMLLALYHVPTRSSWGNRSGLGQKRFQWADANTSTTTHWLLFSKQTTSTHFQTPHSVAVLCGTNGKIDAVEKTTWNHRHETKAFCSMDRHVKTKRGKKPTRRENIHSVHSWRRRPLINKSV